MAYQREIEAAKKTTFTKLKNGQIEVQDAVVIWPNFEGRPTDFVRDGGKRTFSLVLNDVIAPQLKQEGWNVKYRLGQDKDDEPLITTEIVVNMNSKYPPKMYLVTEWNGENNITELESDELEEFDRIINRGEVEKIDLYINPYEHDRDQHKVKGYLTNCMYLTQMPDTNFGGRYAGMRVNKRQDYTEAYD